MNDPVDFLRQAHEKDEGNFPRRVTAEREILSRYESAKARYQVVVACLSPVSADGYIALGEYSCLNLVVRSLAKAWGWRGDHV